MVCLFKCIIAGAKILIISLIIAFFIIFFHVLAFIVIMSVFHCFEDAFSFLPGGKNLMFLGAIWFQVSCFKCPLAFSP